MRLYTAKEAAEALRVSKQTIWKYGREGKLKTVHFGRTARYILPEEEAWTKTQERCLKASSVSEA